MVDSKQDRVTKLDKEFSRLGFGSGQRGDAVNRAHLIGVLPGTLRTWLNPADKRRLPQDHAFAALKMFSMLGADQRAEYIRWSRECGLKGDYSPD